MKKYKSGYTVDNLGLPVWVVKAISEEFQGKSIHYAIQQILKNRYSNKR